MRRLPIAAWTLSTTMSSLGALCHIRHAHAEEALRPLSTDRPDVTESPNTVDAGHFQVEADVARLTRDEGSKSLGFMDTNLKAGLLDFWDVQLVVESLAAEKVAGHYRWGFGDVTLRTKFNLVGNDQGDVSFGVMPWGKWPTARFGNGDVDGGLIALLGVALPADFAMGFMVEGDVIGNEANERHHFELLTTWTLGHPVWGPLGAFVEGVGLYSREPGAKYALSADGGFTLALTDTFQLDAGGGLGITRAAEDLSVFFGASYKL